MDKELKNLIADKKLSDEYITKAINSALTAESAAAGEEQSDKPADTDPAGSEEDAQHEDDHEDDQQDESESQGDSISMKDLDAIVSKKVDERLKSLKMGRKAPKSTQSKKVEPKKIYNYNQEFGAL